MDHKIQPNYKLIFQDIIKKKYPEKSAQCQSILDKEELNTMDVIKLESILFKKKNKQDFSFDQRHRSYDKTSVEEILQYQIKYQLSNSELARELKMSRNTISKWKKQISI